MFQRLLALTAVAFLFAACETAPKATGDSAAGSASGGTSAAASSSGAAATETQMSPADKLAQVGNTVFFGFDSAELSAESKDTLVRQAAFLNVNPTLVVVVEATVSLETV